MISPLRHGCFAAVASEQWPVKEAADNSKKIPLCPPLLKGELDRNIQWGIFPRQRAVGAAFYIRKKWR